MNTLPETDAAVWVETTLASMSLSEKIGHLMCPSLGNRSEAELAAILEKIPLGSAFFSDWDSEAAGRGIDILQKHSRIPVLIAADMEAGAGFGTVFPNAMGCSAAGAEEAMYERGRITAREARSAGFHWSFAPCVDINYNFRNVETGLRSWGDTPEQVMRMVLPLIRGMQEGGLLAATAKHFPGTGVDDRDQHLCTAVNPLKVGDWMDTYGKVWSACFEAGVMSVMPGHISLPDWEGLGHAPAEAMPATLNAALQKDLLRDKLGFDGVIVSDAGVMIGCSSRIPAEHMMLRNLQTGGDVFLFPDLERDFDRMLRAVEEGELTESRIDESVRRVLHMKHRLGLHRSVRCDPPDEAAKAGAAERVRNISENSVTLLRNDGTLPIQLPKNARVLTVTIKNNTDVREPHRCPPLDIVDEELRARGHEVDHWDTPEHSALKQAVEAYDWIFINLHNPMHSMIGNMRLIHRMAMCFWEAFWVGHPKVTWTSFANPYHLYEFPHWPNMVLTWGHSPWSQRAVVKVWLGEMEAKGRCPVAMPPEAGPCENLQR
ncbi:MAG: hypothetical protein JJU05_04295 [Verrucomicrobia bacterium]|nr:hypothetical protein [Verrucomicrobiota bacterium]MCH8525552.1 hypothetical protein [Kiritimatiellia bacterium]